MHLDTTSAAIGRGAKRQHRVTIRMAREGSAKFYRDAEKRRRWTRGRKFIAAGPPGSGKSAVLTMLTDDAEVIPEAATDVNEEMLAAGISRPELDIAFLPRIVSLQRQRRLAAGGKLQVHDRSVYCTLALARFHGTAEPTELRGSRNVS